MSTQINLTQEPVLVIMFGIDGCDACTEQKPILKAVAAKHPDIPTYAIDCNKQGEAADAYGIKATPTTYLLSYGRVINRLEGMHDANVIEMLFAKAKSLKGA